MAKQSSKPPQPPAATGPAPRSPQGGSSPEPAQSAPALVTAPTVQPAPTTSSDSGVSPIMQSSLPPMAAGSDSYSRQFYGGNNLPKRRFLPIGLVP